MHKRLLLGLLCLALGVGRKADRAVQRSEQHHKHHGGNQNLHHGFAAAVAQHSKEFIHRLHLRSARR